ncbi:MAG: SDR family oxidoreductase [Chitinophagales bacterium]|nr:SDR family oxidoreductase [Chitinophagales bacterium]
MSIITIVSGATSGIGYETALQLAKLDHEIYMICRNPEKAERVRDDIQKISGNDKIFYEIADLSSQSEIRQASANILDKTDRVDRLINNAGIWSSKREITADSAEKVFAVNHLSFFLLAHCLYSGLKKSEDARVINVSSDAHFKSKMFFDDLSLEKNYHGLRSYAQSKLANVLFTYEFDRRNTDANVTINAVQPGLVKTDIGVKDTNWFHALAWKIRRSGGVSPKEGASTSVLLASSQSVKGLSGQYWDSLRPKESSKRSYNESDAKKLWEISMQMCGIDEYF